MENNHEKYIIIGERKERNMARLILVIIAPILIFSVEWINVCIWDELIKRESERRLYGRFKA